MPTVLKLQSIDEIWKDLGFRLPFIVRRDCWKEGTFFVVRRIPYRRSEVLVFGDLYRCGQFIKSREVICCRCLIVGCGFGFLSV